MKRKVMILLLTQLLLSVNAESLNSFERSIPQNVKTIKVVIPIYSQRVAFQLPTNWKPAFQNQNANMFLMEFTPKNEDIKSWNNIVSVQGFNNLASKINPEQFLDNLASMFKSTCGQYLVYEKMGSPVIDGYQSATAILGCSKMPNTHLTGIKKGQSEIGYYFVIKGEKDIYMIHKSKRGNAFKNSNVPLTNENVTSFISSIMPLELCKNIGEQPECIK